MRICLTKQRTCYDLYTKGGDNPRELVESSNWRSGPIGIWEKWSCEVRILEATDDPECNVGRKMWEKYVQGWDIWPEGQRAENVEDIDWGQYDIVIAIDVAVPTRILRKFPTVMWCYYFVEGGPLGIDTIFQGSPFYGYNVFLNHRPAKERLAPSSSSWQLMTRAKRAVLDFPYYLQSSQSVQLLYNELQPVARTGVVLGHHSYGVIDALEEEKLQAYGGVKGGYKTIADIHKLELGAKYFIFHPQSKKSAGLAMVEAISAGCLVLSPRRLLWGFPELVLPELDFNNFEELLRILDSLEKNPDRYEEMRRHQAAFVDQCFFDNPLANMEAMFSCFQDSAASPKAQQRSERWHAVKGKVQRLVSALKRRIGIPSVSGFSFIKTL